ncbi:hypothetical protein [Thiobacillus denitrificans]|uniref:hypothetical protein n=1 Tax=Thiobacillus denitrificans TaxID=36861 RepID=UPI0012F81CBF|nr:hypothetical protein [Thiobacillus denitrificans]
MPLYAPRHRNTVADNQNSMTADLRGPVLMQDCPFLDGGGRTWQRRRRATRAAACATVPAVGFPQSVARIPASGGMAMIDDDETQDMGLPAPARPGVNA